MSDGVVIVGAGQGGASACLALRKEGYDGRIHLVGAEPRYPYERPPLSKEFLAGEKPFERLLIRPSGFWAERDIELHLGQTVDAIDLNRKAARLSNSDVLSFDKLIWAAGGAARKLSCSGADLEGVFTLRSAGDSEAIRDWLPQASNVVVIGAGFVGLEVAAVLAQMGKQVTVLEAAPRVMARVAGRATSTYFEALHRSCGVSIQTRAEVVAIEGAQGQVSTVELSSGDRLPADMVIVGIGMIPTGIPIADTHSHTMGVRVDESCRTEHMGIYAVGDCTVHESRFAGGAAVRVESVQNANDQALVAAANIVGKNTHYDAVPWFWSHQHGVKFQSTGLALGADRELVIGDQATGKFAVAYMRGDELAAVDSINAPAIFVRSRKLILERFTRDDVVIEALS